METVKIVCNIVSTLCICAVSFGILYEYAARAKQERKMLQELNKRVEILEKRGVRE